MATTTDWLIESITKSIDCTAEKATAATAAHRHSYHACLSALNDLLGRVLINDNTVVFTMLDLSNQIRADLDGQPAAPEGVRAPMESLIHSLDTWVRHLLLTKAPE